MGSGIAKVPGGNPQKYLQVNKPIHAGSWCLNTHTDGGGHLGLKNPPNLQVPLRKLPYLVIFTHMGVTSPSTGTCGSHLSQMGVTASVKKIPAGIICRGPAGPLCYALVKQNLGMHPAFSLSVQHCIPQHPFHHHSFSFFPFFLLFRQHTTSCWLSQ